MLYNGKYDIIYCDPPWKFWNWSNDELLKRGEKWARKNGRSPYAVMELDDICNLPVSELASKNCVLFLWTTYPKIPDALKVIDAWGFEYKTVAFTRVKRNKKSNSFYFGLGYWTRGNPEICLLATKGKPKRKSKFVANLVIERVGEHSAKPDVVRDKIVELMGDLPRIELFARKIVDGWDVLGYDIDGMDIRYSIKKILYKNKTSTIFREML